MKGFWLLFSFLAFVVFMVSNFSFAGNPFMWNLLWTQLEIWLNKRSIIWDYRDWKAWNALSMQQEITYWNQYGLISELDKAKTEQERLKIVDQYVSLLSNAVYDGSNMYNYEKSRIEYFENASKECEAPIKWKNSEFSEAIKSYNYEKAEAISNEIAELRACIARNDVYAKAHASYASAAKSLGDLQKKAEYLSENREKIARYYEILKPDLLKELYDISKKVNSDF